MTETQKPRTTTVYLHANGAMCESYSCRMASDHDAVEVNPTHGLPLVAGTDYSYAARPARTRR